MATLTIHDVDETLHVRLQDMAAEHGRSLEDEVRAILRSAAARRKAQVDIATQLRREFEDFHREFGDVNLELPDRNDPGRPVELPE